MKTLSTLQIQTPQGQLFIEHAALANTFWSRTVGLLNSDHLDTSSGLMIDSCKQVHTFFMRYPIDVIFLNKQNEIVGIETLKPWRISAYYRKAQKVLEINAKLSQKYNLKMGDILGVKHV